MNKIRFEPQQDRINNETNEYHLCFALLSDWSRSDDLFSALVLQRTLIRLFNAHFEGTEMITTSSDAVLIAWWLPPVQAASKLVRESETLRSDEIQTLIAAENAWRAGEEGAVKPSVASLERLITFFTSLRHLKEEPSDIALMLPYCLLVILEHDIPLLSTGDEMLREVLRCRCGLGRSVAAGWLFSSVVDIDVDMLFDEMTCKVPAMIEEWREDARELELTSRGVSSQPVL